MVQSYANSNQICSQSSAPARGTWAHPRFPTKIERRSSRHPSACSLLREWGAPQSAAGCRQSRSSLPGSLPSSRPPCPCLSPLLCPYFFPRTCPFSVLSLCLCPCPCLPLSPSPPPPSLHHSVAQSGSDHPFSTPPRTRSAKPDAE